MLNLSPKIWLRHEELTRRVIELADLTAPLPSTLPVLLWPGGDADAAREALDRASRSTSKTGRRSTTTGSPIACSPRPTP
jgi:hypothetical protein